MKTGLVGPSYQERSPNLDAQRTVNLYPVLDPQGKEVSALYGTPGLAAFAQTSSQPVRGMFPAANGRCFAVSGAALFEIFANGSAVNRGTLNSASGIVSMDENGFQLGICDGALVYMFTYATGTFALVTDVDLPSAGTLSFIDGYFVVTKNFSGSFYISALYDGMTWSALDFATAESSPDNLARAISAVGQLWLQGTKTTEIWTNTGASAFPFARIAGAKMEVGILAPHTAISVDNSLFWVGQDNIGSGIVYRAQGFTPQRISTAPIELILQAAPTPLTLRSYTYQEDGHVFYVITGGGMATTLVYDVTTQMWHERCYLNAMGQFEAHLGACSAYAFGMHLVGSRLDGTIYKSSSSLYSDDSNVLAAERTFTHLSKEGARLFFNRLEIAMESGVGLQSGQGSDPQISLRISRDGGHTWSTEYFTSFGAVGKYETRAVFRRLGTARDLVFRVRITDPVKRALIGGYLT